MRRMVRLIVAGLVRVGQGLLGPDDLRRILSGTDSNPLGSPAPPQGLYLVSVEY
jgi:tRNA U38,U39,U40 pseudouridine synthase TruA